nr:O-antigen ligase family protein [Motilibacter deserti]
MAIVSVAAAIESVQIGFQPSYPLWFNKNFSGSVFATTLLVVLTAPDQFRLPRWLLVTGGVTIAVGLLATQSRGAMLGAAVGCAFWFLRMSPEVRRKYRKLALVVMVAFGAFVYISVDAQLERQRTTTPIDSFTEREDEAKKTQQLWMDNPATGVGLRYFAQPGFTGYIPPNNVLNEVLAEAGLPGLVGFLVFVYASVTGLWRMRSPLATAGLAVVVARFVHGLVDIYWIGGQSTLPWLIAGMGLAMQPVASGRAMAADSEAGPLPALGPVLPVHRAT